ncbi:MAG: alpha/beta fold hydrolase [Deltaproteobacteria bacterium]|nr:MAG: alpha/beta fold hydrolase [Deltaproteobacteria bacterium]
MPETIINGAKIHYQDNGTGHPLILAHGLGGDLTMWLAQVPVLSQRYRVITWDCRGHGLSEITEDGYSLQNFVDDQYKLLRYLGVEKAHVGGLSMGGLIAWTFALAHPETVTALVLSDTAGVNIGVDQESRRQITDMFMTTADIAEKRGRGGTMANQAIRLMFCDQFIRNNPEIIAMVKERITNSSGVGFARTVRGVFGTEVEIQETDITRLLATIKAPTLVLVGKEDLLTPVPTAEALSRAIPGARLHIFENAGHVPNIEQAEEWNRVVMDFLDGVKV